MRLAEIIRQYAADYRQRYPQHCTPERARALQAILHCRSAMAPQLLDQFRWNDCKSACKTDHLIRGNSVEI